MTKRYSFPKARRLLSNSQFRVVLGRRLSASDGLLVIYALENNLDSSRIGVSIGRSCGSAVVRNRLKRLLREAFRQNQANIQTGFDYVVSMSPRWVSRLVDKRSAKDAVKSVTFEQIRDSLLALTSKLASRRA